MQTEKYTYLIYQQLHGDLSSAEEKALAEWLAASPENEKIRKEIVTSMEMLDDFQPDFSVDVEADYAQLKQQMEIPGPRKNIKTVDISSRRKWLGVAAAVFLLVAASIFLLQPEAPAVQEWKTLATAVGETQEIDLADGSKVWINENTTFSYLNDFSGEKRTVKLEGEAFFDIAKNPNQPFEIVTAESMVEVLGTSFNVRAYKDEPKTTVIVKTGRVKFKTQGTSDNKILTQKDKAVLSHADKTIVTSTNENFNELFWQSNQLSFKNTPLTEVFKTLEKYFEVKITCENDNLKNCPHSMTPRNADLEKLFESMSKVYQIKVKKVNEKQYIISGGNC